MQPDASRPPGIIVQPHGSLDSKTIVYSDYWGSTPPLVAVDVRAGKATNLTNPGQYGYDRYLPFLAPDLSFNCATSPRRAVKRVFLSR